MRQSSPPERAAPSFEGHGEGHARGEHSRGTGRRMRRAPAAHGQGRRAPRVSKRCTMHAHARARVPRRTRIKPAACILSSSAAISALAAW